MQSASSIRQRSTLYVLTSLVLVCCGDDWSAAEASRLATPHMGSFNKLDAWVRRTAASDPGFRTHAALEETMFAPLRSEETIVAAWVIWEESGETASLNESIVLPTNLSWMSLRDDEHGAVRVARSRLQSSAPSAQPSNATDCVIIAKSARVAANRTLRVAAAYPVAPR